MKNSNRDSDFEVIESIKKGDTLAFRLIVEKYKDVSFSLACSIIRDEHYAEDALQESFIKVYKNISKFRYSSNFSTWLYRIVVNTCVSIAQKQKRKNFSLPIDSISDIVICQDKTSIDKLIASERTQFINKAIDTLKTNEALLLRLYYLSELELSEIIAVTGFSESKIKVTLFRARENLLKVLREKFCNDYTFQL